MVFRRFWDRTVNLFKGNPYEDLTDWEQFVFARIQMASDYSEDKGPVKLSYSQIRKASKKFGGTYTSDQKIKEAITSLEEKGLITREIISGTSAFTLHRTYHKAPYLEWVEDFHESDSIQTS